MFTNTASADTPVRPRAVTATTIAVDAAERDRDAAGGEIDWLLDTGAINAAEAADLEAETNARYITRVRELELRGEEIVDPRLWAEYEALAARQRTAAVVDRRRSPRLPGVSAQARARRERQMCVVASARVSTDVLGWLRLDEDDEALAMRDELAAAGLL